MIGILLALCLLLGFALAENDWDDDWDEFGENWEYFESRFGFTLWYNADQLCFWVDEWNDQVAECFCPWEDHSGVAMLACVGSRFSMTQWDDCTRIELDDPGVWLEYPYEMTAFIDAYESAVTEQWIISAPAADYVFIIQYEPDDPENWALLFHDMLCDLEFPSQPAENASFRLDFFQGGAAGMQFYPVTVDADAEPMVLMPLEEVTGFALELLDWDMDTWEASAEALFTAGLLVPGDNLLIYCYLPDMLPNLRIRYVDGDGQAQSWYISQSGRDGSLLFLAEDEL